MSELEQILFPKIAAFDEGYINVSEIHSLWYGQYGNPYGVPVLWLHGGPGHSCSDSDARYFDPSYYRIILLDQRGSGKSKPFCELRENNTEELVKDIERLRNHLDIEKWIVLGGSWGSCLALSYAILHHEKILGIILRGVYTATEKEMSNIWYGMRDTFPDAWQEFYDVLPESERHDLDGSYCKRIMGKDKKASLEAIKSFVKYDTICAFFSVNTSDIEKDLANETGMISLATIFAHYHTNSFFLDDNYISKNLYKIKDLPCIIVHGRYDTICRASVAYDVHKQLNKSSLRLVHGGHTINELSMSIALKQAIADMQSNVIYIPTLDSESNSYDKTNSQDILKRSAI